LLLDGYTYRLDRSNDRGIEQWRCSKKRFRGRIHLHSSFLYSNITFISSHSYSAESAQCQAAIVINHIRTTAQYNHHESAKDIVDRLLKLI
jgi:UDP-3-O-[3-hydroxymyristoyl] glucosamine N-acyltransferase